MEIVVGPGYFKRPDKPDDPWTRVDLVKDWNAARVQVADLNGNGNPDIILSEAETYPGRFAWFEWPDWKMHVLRDDLNHAHSLEVADFDGDGTIDIFVEK